MGENLIGGDRCDVFIRRPDDVHGFAAWSPVGWIGGAKQDDGGSAHGCCEMGGAAVVAEIGRAGGHKGCQMAEGHFTDNLRRM